MKTKCLNLKKLSVTVLLLFALVFGFMTFPASAASVSFSLSGATVTEGQTVSVTFKSSVPIGGIQAIIKYDQSFLRYESYSGGLGTAPAVSNGTIGIADIDMSSTTDRIYSITFTFTALKPGNTTIRTSGFKVFDGTGDTKLTVVAEPSSSIIINAKPTASSDATLKSLSVSPGSLSPAFSSSRTSYTVSVANSVTSIAVSAAVNHSAAKYSVSGNTKLSVGKNTVTVKVTAENGATKSYVITVTRAAAETPPIDEPDNPDTPENPDNPDIPETPDTPAVTVTTADGNEMAVSEFDDTLIPAGFKRTEITVDETSVSAITCVDEGSVALYLTPTEASSEAKAGFYYYDPETGSATPVYQLGSAAVYITVLDIPNSLEIPEGYIKAPVTIRGETFYAFVPADGTADSYIIYAVDASGKAGLYVYDTDDETLQKYGIIAVPEKDEVPAEKTYPEYYKWIAVSAAAVMIILLVGFILFAVLYAKTLKRYKKLLAAKKRAAMRRREKEKIKQDTDAVRKIDNAEKANVADDIIFELEKEEEKPDFDGIIDFEPEKKDEKPADFDGEILFGDIDGKAGKKPKKKKKNGSDAIFDDETINLLFGDDSSVPPEK